MAPALSLLYLIGYRGCGKSTVARLVAEQLGWAWTDADALLEARHGRSIRQIFADEGEVSFRDKETAILAELCTQRNHVVATGGGVVLRPENRQRLLQTGQIIWLRTDAATLWQRLQQDTTTAQRRPDLTVGGLAEIEELLRRREPLYRSCAHHCVDTAERSPVEVAQTILALLENEGGIPTRRASEGVGP